MPQNFNAFFNNLNNIQTSVPSLAEQKAQLLAQHKAEKVAKVNPEVASQQAAKDVYESMFGPEDQSNTLDAVQSGFVQTAGNLTDMGYNIADRISSGLGGTPFARDSEIAKEVDKWSNPEYANKLVGYDSTAYDQAMNSASNDVANGDILGALKTGVANLPETLARSAGSVSELAVGAALAPETGGASLLGVMGHLATKAPKIAKVMKAAYSAFKGATLYGSDQANQYAEAYQKETGHKQPLSEVATNTVVATTLGALEVDIFKGAFKAGTLGTFKRTATDLLKVVDPTESVGKTVVGNIVNNAAKVVSGGTAEGVQEYLETWHQILASSDKPLAKQLENAVNQNQALTGAVIGFGTAGGLTAIPATTSAGTITTLGAGSKIIRTAANKGQKKLTEQQYKILSQEQRDKLHAQNKEREAKQEETDALRNEAIDNIKSADSIDTLKAYNDPEVTTAIEAILDKDNTIQKSKSKVEAATTEEEFGKDAWTIGKLDEIKKSNPSKVEYNFDELKSKLLDALDNRYDKVDLEQNLDKIKNRAIAQYNKQIELDKEANRIINAKDVVSQVSSNLYEKTKEQVDKVLPKEVRDAIVEQAKKGVDLAKTGVEVVADEVKNLNKSAVKGIIDDIANGKPNEAIYNFSTAQLEDLKQGFKDNEKAAKIIAKVLKQKEATVGTFKKHLAKDTSLFDKVVDVTGKILTSNIGVKARGLSVITKEFLTDSDNLSRSKKVIKDLEKARDENPENFSKEEQRRLITAQTLVQEAIDTKAEGAINSAIRSLSEEYKTLSNDPKLKKLYKDTIHDIKVRYRKSRITAKSKLKEYDIEGYISDKLNDLNEKLEEVGKPPSKTNTSSKKKNKTKTKVDNSAEAVDEAVTHFSETNVEDLVNALIDQHGMEGLASMLSNREIEKLIDNKNSNVANIGVELNMAKALLPVEDVIISNNKDKKLSHTDTQHNDDVDTLVNILCKG